MSFFETMQEKKPTCDLEGNGSNDVEGAVDWSLTRIHGSNTGYPSFKQAMKNNGLFIDKTLLCKAFFDIKETVICVSAPVGFGMLTNINILESFFHVVTLNDMPASTTFGICCYHNKPEIIPETAKAQRAELFEPTLLCQQLLPFFNDHFCQHPVIRINLAVRNVLSAIQQWVNSFNPKQLNDKQKACYDILSKTYAEITADLKNCRDNQQDYKTSPKALFACLSDFVGSISPERYIVIVDNCDMPFIELQGKPWDNEIRQMLLELLLQMLKDNDRLLKALLVGTYAFPLNELDLDSVVSINPAFNGCFQQQLKHPLTNEQAIASMFGYTESEVYEVAERLNINEQDKLLFDYYGGYNFGYKGSRFNCAQVFSCAAMIKGHQSSKLLSV
ncbi:hypothetical protein IWW36_004969, partial [Coemansia brasiliensis]